MFSFNLGLKMASQGQGEASYKKSIQHFHPQLISQQTEQFFKEVLMSTN